MPSSFIPSSFRAWEEDGKNKKHNPHRIAQIFWKRREQLLLHGLDGWEVAQGIKRNINCSKQRRRNKTKRQQSHNLLTEDVVAGILSWLPVKSLMRFRCVCKSWCSLTYDPYFQKQQHERSARRTTIVANIVTEDYAPFRMRMYSLGIDNKKITDCSFKLTIPSQQNGDGVERYFSIWNSVNGLTCVYDYGEEGDCYLMNPSTREIEKLPKSRCWNDGYIMSLGLGFDSSTGVYKVIRILEYDDFAGNYDFGYEILTLGIASQQWRFIGEIPCFMIDETDIVFVNGVFHWLAFSYTHIKGRSRHKKIFTVDIKDENYGSISTPGPRSSVYDAHSQVALQNDLEGHLLFLKHSQHPKHQVRIWIMKDHASREWTNTYNVNMYAFPHDSLQLIGIAYDNVMFRRDTWVSDMLVGRIYCFDLRRKTSQKVYWRILADTVLYTEGLFSPRNVLSNTNAGSIKM